MPWSGAGVANRLFSWVVDAANGVKIRSDRMDQEFDNYKAMIENCITRDNQTPPTTNISFGNNKITSLSNGVLATDAVNKSQLDTAAGTVKVSPNDTTPGDLETKLLAGSAIALATQNDGADETRTIDVDITGTAAETVFDDADEILVYDDSAAENRKMTRANFLPPVVTQVEAEAGTETATRLWSPERVKQAIDELATAGPAVQLYYDQTGPAVIASENVSSVTDDGTGLFTISFAITFADNNYYIGGNCATAGGRILNRRVGATNTTTQVTVDTRVFTGSLEDGLSYPTIWGQIA